jgi:hypothetical protein
MGSFRFYRRVHIFPGLTVNVSRSGPSLSVGVRGAHVTVGRARRPGELVVADHPACIRHPGRAGFDVLGSQNSRGN